MKAHGHVDIKTTMIYVSMGNSIPVPASSTSYPGVERRSPLRFLAGRDAVLFPPGEQGCDPGAASSEGFAGLRQGLLQPPVRSSIRIRTSKWKGPGSREPPGPSLRHLRREIEYVLKLTGIRKVLQIYPFPGGIREGSNWVT